MCRAIIDTHGLPESTVIIDRLAQITDHGLLADVNFLDIGPLMSYNNISQGVFYA
jgi:hypothetical protein